MTKAEQLRAEFAEKNKILESYGSWLSPWDFYDLLFPGFKPDDKIMAVEAGKRFVAVRFEDAVDFARGRDDVYFCAARFWDDCKKDRFIDELYAYVVDIDDVKPQFLESIMYGLQRGSMPMPTVVTNSGSGIHLYYILRPALRTHPAVRKMAMDMYAFMSAQYEFKVDKHTIGHAYRAVGGLTKLGDVTTAYLTGDTWTNAELADYLGWFWIEPDPTATKAVVSEKMISFATVLAESSGDPLPDFSDYNATYLYIRNHVSKKFKATDLTAADLQSPRAEMYTTAEPNGSPLWYTSVRVRVQQQTQLEHRYSSLMALSVIAYKCRVPYDTLVQDINRIADDWELDPRWRADPFNRKNVPAALRCYNQKFLKVRKETLEEWLGWKFNRRAKPKNNQVDHLRGVADKKRGHSLSLLIDALRDNPTASKAEVGRKTGLSRPTVSKYYDAAKLMAGIK